MGFEGSHNEEAVSLPATAKEAFEDWKARSDSREGVDVMANILSALEAGDKGPAISEVKRLISIIGNRIETEGVDNTEGEVGPNNIEKLRRYLDYLEELS